jgi:hypothetical protein
MPRDIRSMRRSSPKLPIVYQNTVELTHFPLNNKPASRHGQRIFAAFAPLLTNGCGFDRAKGGFSGDSPSLPTPPALGCYPESEGFSSDLQPLGAVFGYE